MTKRKRIIAEVAKQVVDRKIKLPLTPSDLDKFSKHSSHKLRRLFGSFRRAMKMILNEVNEIQVDKPVEVNKPAEVDSLNETKVDKPTEVKKPTGPAKPKATTVTKTTGKTDD